MFNLLHITRSLFGIYTQVTAHAPSNTLDPVNAIYTSKFDALDHVLPHQGWANRRVHELLIQDQGVIELQLIVPVLKQLSRTNKRIYLLEAPSPSFIKLLAQYGIPEAVMCVIGGKHTKDQARQLVHLTQQSQFGGLLIWADAERSDLIQLAHELVANSNGLFFVLSHQNNKRNLNPDAIRLRIKAQTPDSLTVTLVDYRSKPISDTSQLTFSPSPRKPAIHIRPLSTAGYHSYHTVRSHTNQDVVYASNKVSH